MEVRVNSDSIEPCQIDPVLNEIRRTLVDTFEHLLNRIDEEFIYPPDANISDVSASESIHLFDVRVWLDTQYLDMRISMKATMIKEE